MKKIKLLGFAVCALTLAGAVGCGGDTTNPDPNNPGDNPGQTTDDFADYGNVKEKIFIWASDAECDVINDIVDDYNAQQTDANKKFNVELKAVSEADAGTTLSNDPTVANAPALFLCADDHINNLVSKNIVLEVQGAYKDRIEENIADISITASSLNGKLYGFPVTSDNGYFLWYNSDYFTADDVTSLEKIINICKTESKTIGFDIENGYYANSFIMSPQAAGLDSLKWTRNSQGQIVYNINWDNAEAIKVSEYAQSLLQPLQTSGTIVGDTAGANALFAQGFTDGDMIACISGTWMESDLTKAIGAEKLAATKLPEYHVDGKAYQMASFSGTKVYCINKTRPAAEQRVAAALADLLTTKEAQLRRYEIRQSVPCNEEARLDARYKEHLTKSAVAIQAQSEFSATQSQAAEGRYWDAGKAIGGCYIKGLPAEYPTWEAYLKYQCDMLRKAQ